MGLSARKQLDAQESPVQSEVHSWHMKLGQVDVGSAQASRSSECFASDDREAERRGQRLVDAVLRRPRVDECEVLLIAHEGPHTGVVPIRRVEADVNREGRAAYPQARDAIKGIVRKSAEANPQAVA